MTADHERAFQVVADADPNTYWERHLKSNNLNELFRIEHNYPQERIITIDVSKVLQMEIWAEILKKPLGQEDHIFDAARKIMRRADHGYPSLRARFINVTKKVKIKDLRSGDEKKLISIKALVKRVTEIRPKIVTAHYMCPAGHVQMVNEKNNTILPPRACTINGCDYRTFDHLDNRDIKIDRQWIYIQDPLEDLTDGGQPSFLKCEVVEDLCGHVMAGDRVILNGVYRSVPVYKQGVLTAGKDVFFDVRGIELGEREFDEVRLTDEDLVQITELSKRENIYETLCESVAPSILGMKLLKQAIVLLLFEGVTRTLKDGVINRGHINVLCVSDPGMAKTRLLRFVASIAPRGVFTNATTSTKVGLIAPIVRDETTGEYTVQAGAYMIASGGILCLDEVSELTKEDFKYLNEAMEDGEAHITKGGLNITVKTRASQLAACNPTEGSFDPFRPLAAQVKIPESTLSRYDLKILLQDISEEVKDRAMINHITNNHMDGVDLANLLDPVMMRKYIAHGRTFKPKLTKESKKVIDDYYVAIRKEIGNGDQMKITPRQGTACIRLAEAHARVRLSDEVSKEDAESAVSLFDQCFRNIATDPVTGKVDMSRTDHKPSRESMMSALFRTIKEIGSGGSASEAAILTAMSKYDGDKVLALIRDLKNEGKLFEPKNGVWKVM